MSGRVTEDEAKRIAAMVLREPDYDSILTEPVNKMIDKWAMLNSVRTRAAAPTALS